MFGRSSARDGLRAVPLAVLSLALAWLLPGCGTGEPPRAAPAAEGLPPYSPAAASLFDDSFAPEIFGISIGSDPAKNHKLASRTSGAEAVVVAKIATITRDTTGSSLAYQLVLSPIGAPLAGAWSGAPVDIEVDEKNPSFPLVDSAGVTLTGRRVILFLRRYDQDGRATLHFRAEADTPNMVKAIRRAHTLEAFGP